jgi:hypothetical protein
MPCILFHSIFLRIYNTAREREGTSESEECQLMWAYNCNRYGKIIGSLFAKHLPCWQLQFDSINTWWNGVKEVIGKFLVGSKCLLFHNRFASSSNFSRFSCSSSFTSSSRFLVSSRSSNFFSYPDIKISSLFLFHLVMLVLLVSFYLPHMEYEGSIGFVSRKMKIFYCWFSRFRTFYG